MHQLLLQACLYTLKSKKVTLVVGVWSFITPNATRPKQFFLINKYLFFIFFIYIYIYILYIYPWFNFTILK